MYNAYNVNFFNNSGGQEIKRTYEFSKIDASQASMGTLDFFMSNYWYLHRVVEAFMYRKNKTNVSYASSIFDRIMKNMLLVDGSGIWINDVATNYYAATFAGVNNNKHIVGIPQDPKAGKTAIEDERLLFGGNIYYDWGNEYTVNYFYYLFNMCIDIGNAFRASTSGSPYSIKELDGLPFLNYYTKDMIPTVRQALTGQSLVALEFYLGHTTPIITPPIFSVTNVNMRQSNINDLHYIEKTGLIGFMFLKAYYSDMRKTGPLRRSVPYRTLSSHSPMTNPLISVDVIDELVGAGWMGLDTQDFFSVASRAYASIASFIDTYNDYILHTAAYEVYLVRDYMGSSLHSQVPGEYKSHFFVWDVCKRVANKNLENLDAIDILLSYLAYIKFSFIQTEESAFFVSPRVSTVYNHGMFETIITNDNLMELLRDPINGEDESRGSFDWVVNELKRLLKIPTR